MSSKKHLPGLPSLPTSLVLFCNVIDNFGDIGICWRLARQLALEHRISVTLWVDDLDSFQKICPTVANTEIQQIEQVTIRHWHHQNAPHTTSDVADVVIEFFGCEIPSSYITAMTGRVPRPVWLNLEGLSAENWVEGCHTLSSPHPSLPLTKYFFFPGFTNKTGGLLLESTLLHQRQLFQQNPATQEAFLKQLGVTSSEMASTKISLFCYPHAPLLALFNAWQSSNTPVTCLVPENVASEAVQTFLGQAAKAGISLTRGALTIRVIPFIPQPDYDKLLWACDLNFVRGEDSFVRAQWANRPFIWHIYPQDNHLHHIKLTAFLQRLTANTKSLVAFSLAWNAATNEPLDFVALWNSLKTDMPTLSVLSEDWQRQLIKNGDLASNMMQFINSLWREMMNGD